MPPLTSNGVADKRICVIEYCIERLSKRPLCLRSISVTRGVQFYSSSLKTNAKFFDSLKIFCAKRKRKLRTYVFSLICY